MGRLYVVGEANDDIGPVKIGLTYKKKTAGLNRGNWRKLVELAVVDVDADIVRWREWLTHRRLREFHVRGEWFDVRHLASDGNWDSLLERLWIGTEPAARPFVLGVDGHQAEVARRIGDGRQRHFQVECSCGELFDGGVGVAMPTVLRHYVGDHLDQPEGCALLEEIAHETHHANYTLNPYSPT